MGGGVPFPLPRLAVGVGGGVAMGMGMEKTKLSSGGGVIGTEGGPESSEMTESMEGRFCSGLLLSEGELDWDRCDISDPAGSTANSTGLPSAASRSFDSCAAEINARMTGLRTISKRVFYQFHSREVLVESMGSEVSSIVLFSVTEGQ